MKYVMILCASLVTLSFAVSSPVFASENVSENPAVRVSVPSDGDVAATGGVCPCELGRAASLSACSKGMACPDAIHAPGSSAKTTPTTSSKAVK